MSCLFLGIDPGTTGAAAIIAKDGALVGVEDLGREAADVSEAIVRLVTGTKRGGAVTVFAALERAQAMPRQGVSSTFTTGRSFGHAEGVLAALAIPCRVTTPSLWKRNMGLDRDKAKSLAMARQLFPLADLDRKKDHGRAEALLLAEWLRRERA